MRLRALIRWARLTTRRYGALSVILKRRKPRHAGVGRAARNGDWGRAHGDCTGNNITTGDITAMLEAERARLNG